MPFISSVTLTRSEPSAFLMSSSVIQDVTPIHATELMKNTTLAPRMAPPDAHPMNKPQIPPSSALVGWP